MIDIYLDRRSSILNLCFDIIYILKENFQFFKLLEHFFSEKFKLFTKIKANKKLKKIYKIN